MIAFILIGQQFASWFLIPLLQRLICNDSGASRINVSAVWKTFKAFNCAILGVFLIVLSTSNPSLALFISLPTVPLLVLAKPSRNHSYLFAQALILVILSPPGVLLLFWLSTGDFASLASFLKDSYQFWDMFGTIFLPCICLFYWPLNIATQVLITMEQ